MKSGLFNTDALDSVCPDGFVKVCEGSTAVLFPPAMTAASKSSVGTGGEDDDDDQAVFYNPAQVVNRDLSICALELFSRLRLTEPPRRGGTAKGITILEALSATGLRAIRYYKEITGVRFIIANDLDPDAVECIRRNCDYNGIPVALPTRTHNFAADGIRVAPVVEEKFADGRKVRSGGGIEAGGAIIPNLDDAVDLMHRLSINPSVHACRRLCLVEDESQANASSHRGNGSGGGEGAPERARGVLQQELMDVVDLDPYGTASPFLDAAMGCIKEGGLMLVTSTDSAILCGNYPDTCHAKYNSISYKGAHCHEMAVRILLACIERAANKHKKYIVPVISLHIDFYVRCFFRVYTQAAETKLSLCKLGYQLQCTHCPAFWVRPMAISRSQRRYAKGKKRGRVAGAVEGEQDQEKANTSESQPYGPAHGRGDDLPCRTAAFPPSPSREANPKVVATALHQLCVSPSPSGEGGVDVCPVCGSAVSFSGPIYCAPTQSSEYLPQLLSVIEERAAEGKITATARISGLVRAAMEELSDCPLFYQLPDIASYVRVRCPPTPLYVGALARLGYRCSQVHCAPAGLKTDCPVEVLVAVMLQWKAIQDAEDAAATATAGTEAVVASGKRKSADAEPVKLRVTALVTADFAYDKKFDFRRQSTGVTKFIPNAPGWGPKRRHQGTLHAEGSDEVNHTE